jgi:hypothetical protein
MAKIHKKWRKGFHEPLLKSGYLGQCRCMSEERFEDIDRRINLLVNATDQLRLRQEVFQDRLNQHPLNR